MDGGRSQQQRRRLQPHDPRLPVASRRSRSSRSTATATERSSARPAGAQINIVTRGGTNEFHGSGFYFGRNDALNATNYFIEKAGQPKDQLSRHDFGWTLGGPIIKDKLHFFASQEWNREQRGTVRTAFVPTAAERAGDFSGPAIAGCTNPTPIDPLTGAAFPGNRIPANRLSRGGQLYLQLYPLPNTTPGPGSCNNWVASLNTPDQLAPGERPPGLDASRTARA